MQPLLHLCTRDANARAYLVTAHSPSTRMHLYAVKGLYIFAELSFQCLHVVHFVSCFRCFLYTIVSTTLSARGLLH